MSCPFTKTYWVDDIDKCDDVISFFEEHDKKYNPKGCVTHRKDKQVYVIPGQPEYEGMMDLVTEMIRPGIMSYINEFTHINGYDLVSGDFKIQRTDPCGGFHEWHCEDMGKDIPTRSRRLVWSLYLNDVEHGGETEFLYQRLRVVPEKGKLAVWPASYTHLHRGNPPLSGTKYIATGWLIQDLPDDRP